MLEQASKQTTVLSPVSVTQFSLSKDFNEIIIEFWGDIAYRTKGNDTGAYSGMITQYYSPLVEIQNLISQDTELYSIIADNASINSDEWQIAALAQKQTRNDGDILMFTLKAVSQESRKKSLRGKIIMDELPTSCANSIKHLFDLLLAVARNEYAHDNEPLFKSEDTNLEEIEIEL